MLSLLGFAADLPGASAVGLFLEYFVIICAYICAAGPVLYWTLLRKEKHAGRTSRNDLFEGVFLTVLSEAYAAAVFLICRFLVTAAGAVILRAGVAAALILGLTVLIWRTGEKIQKERGDA